MSDQIYFDWIEFLNWKENCQPGSICFGATSIKGIQRRRKNNWRKLKIVYDLNYTFWEKFEKTGVEKTSSFHFPATNEIINQLIELTSSLVCLQLVLAKWCFSLTFYFSSLVSVTVILGLKWDQMFFSLLSLFCASLPCCTKVF